MEKMYEEARNFAVNHILPYSKETDEEGVFPSRSFEEMGKAGYFKLVVPEEFGGQGKGIREHSEVCRAFAQSNATAGLCYMMHNVALMCILNYGSVQLKERICRDVVENNKFLALAYSELGTGTHFYIPQIKAEFQEDGATFTGVKSMVTSAGKASYYLILTPSQVEGGIDNWAVPLEAAGLSFDHSTWNGLGMRGNASCQMKMENMKLEKELRIGEEGSGAAQVFETVAPYFVAGLASVYTGLCQNVLEEAISHSVGRKYPSGQSLANIETVQIHLARIYAQTNAAISSTKEAARAASMGEGDALPKILAARILASEAAIEVSRLGMRIGGGKAYNRHGSMERLLRDSYAGQIMAPSVDVLTIWLGKAITGQDLL